MCKNSVTRKVQLGSCNDDDDVGFNDGGSGESDLVGVSGELQDQSSSGNCGGGNAFSMTWTIVDGYDGQTYETQGKASDIRSQWSDNGSARGDWLVGITADVSEAPFPANVANGDEVSFDSIAKIVKGDVTEVKALVKLLENNEVRLLIGVKDGKYQTVYTKVFGRVKPQRDDIFVKNLNDDYGTFNAEFDTTLSWGVFTPELAVVTPDADSDNVSEDEDWV